MIGLIQLLLFLVTITAIGAFAYHGCMRLLEKTKEKKRRYYRCLNRCCLDAPVGIIDFERDIDIEARISFGAEGPFIFSLEEKHRKEWKKFTDFTEYMDLGAFKEAAQLISGNDSSYDPLRIEELYKRFFSPVKILEKLNDEWRKDTNDLFQAVHFNIENKNFERVSDLLENMLPAKEIELIYNQGKDASKLSNQLIEGFKSLLGNMLPAKEIELVCNQEKDASKLSNQLIKGFKRKKRASSVSSSANESKVIEKDDEKKEIRRKRVTSLESIEDELLELYSNFSCDDDFSDNSILSCDRAIDLVGLALKKIKKRELKIKVGQNKNKLPESFEDIDNISLVGTIRGIIFSTDTYVSCQISELKNLQWVLADDALYKQKKPHIGRKIGEISQRYKELCDSEDSFNLNKWALAHKDEIPFAGERLKKIHDALLSENNHALNELRELSPNSSNQSNHNCKTEIPIAVERLKNLQALIKQIRSLKIETQTLMQKAS